MIVDRLEHLSRYACLGQNFATAVRYLAEHSPLAAETGSVPIDGSKVFANVAVNPLSRETPAYELHRHHADIQIVLSGRERFLIGREVRITAAHPDHDFYACDADEAVEFTLGAGQFVIFLPDEPHAPGNPDGQPSDCKKMVVKVEC